MDDLSPAQRTIANVITLVRQTMREHPDPETACQLAVSLMHTGILFSLDAGLDELDVVDVFVSALNYSIAHRNDPPDPPPVTPETPTPTVTPEPVLTEAQRMEIMIRMKEVGRVH